MLYNILLIIFLLLNLGELYLENEYKSNQDMSDKKI
jgi:hypothetical protein